MRLAELNPHWVGLPAGHRSYMEWPIHSGVSFLCPHCRAIRLAVLFRPVIDPGGYLPKIALWEASQYKDQLAWARTGDTFETLTLTPSVDFANPLIDPAHPEKGRFAFNHWHGHITNGEMT